MICGRNKVENASETTEYLKENCSRRGWLVMDLRLPPEGVCLLVVDAVLPTYCQPRPCNAPQAVIFFQNTIFMEAGSSAETAISAGLVCEAEAIYSHACVYGVCLWAA